jgi:hypothetical protein
VNLELLLHFLKFDIQTSSLQLDDWIERLYCSNDLTDRFPAKFKSLKLFVESQNSAQRKPIMPPSQGVFAETNLCNARCYYEAGRFFSANQGDYWHEMEFNLHTNEIRANLGGKFLQSGQAIISNLIRPILQSFILPFYGLRTLHGAVVCKQGRTIFLHGRGGMGKTTTAVQLFAAGYDLLSDDGPFFFIDGASAQVLSSLDYIHLTENTLRLFPQLRTLVVGARDNREKFAVRISDLKNNEAWREPHRITHYIHLQRRPDVPAPSLRKINRNTSHRILLDESMVIFRRAQFQQSAGPFGSYSQFVFDLLGKVIQGAETYELEFADHHLAEIPALVDRL